MGEAVVAAPAQGCGVPWAIALLRLGAGRRRRSPLGVLPCTSMACSSNRPSRPTTPVTAPPTSAGICGAAVPTTALARVGACTVSSGVPNADETTAAGPLTGSRVLPAAGAPTVSPSLCSTEATCATSPARAELAGVLRRASGGGGSRATPAWTPPATASASPEGSCPARTTPRCSTWSAGAGPSWRTSAGTFGAACGRTTRGDGAAPAAAAGASAPAPSASRAERRQRAARRSMTRLHESASLLVPSVASAPWGVGS